MALSAGADSQACKLGKTGLPKREDDRVLGSVVGHVRLAGDPLDVDPERRLGCELHLTKVSEHKRLLLSGLDRVWIVWVCCNGIFLAPRLLLRGPGGRADPSQSPAKRIGGFVLAAAATAVIGLAVAWLAGWLFG